ncbi:unnamed protein product, partial [Laminaria digitata]
ETAERVPVIRLSLGRRSVNLFPVAQQTNTLTLLAPHSRLRDKLLGNRVGVSPKRECGPKGDNKWRRRKQSRTLLGSIGGQHRAVLGKQHLCEHRTAICAFNPFEHSSYKPAIFFKGYVAAVTNQPFFFFEDTQQQLQT